MDNLTPEGEFSNAAAKGKVASAVKTSPKTIAVVTVRPIYCVPGEPPIQPGSLVDCDPKTAEFWVERGIVRYPADAAPSATVTADAGKVISAPLPAAPEMVDPPKLSG